MTRDPALWGFFGVVITTLGAILIALISNRRQTNDVKKEVLNTKDSADSHLVELSQKIDTLADRLNEHIKWHLERTPYVYVRSAERQDFR